MSKAYERQRRLLALREFTVYVVPCNGPTATDAGFSVKKVVAYTPDLACFAVNQEYKGYIATGARCTKVLVS